MTVKELREALEGVPDDYEVSVWEDVILKLDLPAKSTVIFDELKCFTIKI